MYESSKMDAVADVVSLFQSVDDKYFSVLARNDPDGDGDSDADSIEALNGDCEQTDSSFQDSDPESQPVYQGSDRAWQNYLCWSFEPSVGLHCSRQAISHQRFVLLPCTDRCFPHPSILANLLDRSTLLNRCPLCQLVEDFNSHRTRCTYRH